MLDWPPTNRVGIITLIDGDAMLSFAEYKEVLQMRRDFAALRADFKRAVHQYYARKFDPNQPRDDHGRWVDAGGGNVTAGKTPPQILVAGAKQSAAYCWNQMQIDMLLCSSSRSTSIVAACRAQANERYSACLTGRPIPPLPF
jgi:hypothetical protein